MGAQEAFGEIVSLLLPWLVTWALVSSRAFAFTFFFPAFTYLQLPLSVRFAFSATVGLPILAAAANNDVSAIAEISSATLGLLVLKELAIGALIGLIAGLPFWAALNAGETIDSYRGSSAGTLFDPSLTTESTELGAAFILFAIAVLVWSGGFQVLVAVIYASFAIWPPLELLPALPTRGIEVFAPVIGDMLLTALAIAGTMLFALFAIDLAFALTSRSTRQFQVFEMSLNVKNLAFVILMPILALPIVTLIQEQVSVLDDVIAFLRALQ